MTEHTNISQQLEEYKEQHSAIAEIMYAFREVQAIYLEAMQTMREAEIALHPYTISTKSNTEDDIL